MKKIKTILVHDAKESFSELNKIVEEEKQKGIKSSTNQTLLKSIKDKIEILKNNSTYGTHIPKNKIPKEYLELDVDNLWKINLSGECYILLEEQKLKLLH